MTVNQHLEGLSVLRRVLKEAEPGSEHELRRALVRGADVVARQARVNAPRGARRKPPGIPHLADTIRATTARGLPAIRSSSPYANLIHWGGSVPSQRSTSSRPKRHFTARPFIETAVGQSQEEFLADLSHGLDGLYRRLGLE